MKRGIVLGVAGVAGVAVAVAACAGCSSNKSSTGASSSSTPSAAGTQVIVDGQNQNVTGQVTCNSANGVTTLAEAEATSAPAVLICRRASFKRSGQLRSE